MKLNNYSLGILLTTLAGIGFSITLLLLNGFGGIDMPAWLIELIYGSNFIFTLSQLVSGVGYINRGLDTLTNENTALDLFESNQDKPLSGLIKRINGQFLGIVFGIGFAIAMSILMAALKVAIPGSDVVGHTLSSIVHFIGFTASFAGFGNRLGRIFDYIAENDIRKYRFFRRAEVNYVLGATGGIIVGIVLAVVALSVIGITSSMTLGGAIPLWLGAALFTAGAIGGCASAGGYIGRVFDSLLGNRTIIAAASDSLYTKKTIIKKSGFSKESVLTIAGLAIGLTLGIILISAGALTLPMFAAGLPKIVAGFILMATCISALSGFGNRIGYMMDRFTAKNELEYKNNALSFPVNLEIPPNFLNDNSIASDATTIFSPIPLFRPKETAIKVDQNLTLGQDELGISCH
jgi:hypothetical protein